MMHIGERIKAIAKSKGVSVKDLAKRIDRTTQTVYDIYNNRVNLNVDLLEKIAKGLDEPVFTFFVKDPESYYDMIPNAIPMEEVHKLMQSIQERVKDGEGLVNLYLTQSREGIFILNADFLPLRDKLSEEDINRFGNRLYESLVMSSPKIPGKK